jgi:hypothetical protein
VFTGTWGSGESTIAAILAARHGYAAIDGDNVIGQARRRWGQDRDGFNVPAVLGNSAGTPEGAAAWSEWRNRRAGDSMGV